MKVGLYCKHWGLIDEMYGVLKNHDVRLQESWEGHPVWQGDEDVIISTFAYTDLPNYKGDKPLIIYATDPVPLFVLDDFKRLQQETWVTMVVSERCFPQKVQPIISSNPIMIPYALDKSKYFDYTGEIDKVLVVNRKAEERWDEVIKGVTGLGYPLKDYLEGIPFDICNVPDKTEYRKTLAKYKVMFYFSNSPYTIVMWEGMTIGMPMVGFNHSNVTETRPVEKYLHKYSTDMAEIRQMLQAELDKPAEKVDYNIMPYEVIVSLWDMVLEHAISTK